MRRYLVTYHAPLLNRAFPPADRDPPAARTDENDSYSSVGDPNSDVSAGVSSRDDGTFEKWLVRILLILAFGLAFGIEGMTLVRSYLLGDEPTKPGEEQTAEAPTLQENPVLLPDATPTVRIQGMRLLASDEAWVFTLIARPDGPPEHPYTVRFDRLTTGNGQTITTAPSYTWTPADTSAFTASWSLPPGQRPASLTVTGSTQVTSGSTTTATRTVSVGRVPVRMKRD